jgi:hypothetical protein
LPLVKTSFGASSNVIASSAAWVFPNYSRWSLLLWREKIIGAVATSVEEIRMLGNNPNRTTLKQQVQIWKEPAKVRLGYPIITNKDGVYADGEQRAEVCKQHNEFFVPVLRSPVSDVDRRMLRQILNKLKGKHNRELDESEYIRIIQQGEKESLKGLLESVGEKLPQDLGGESECSITLEDVSCSNENALLYKKPKYREF